MDARLVLFVRLRVCMYTLAAGSYLSGLLLQVSDLVSDNCQFVASVSFDKVVPLYKHNKVTRVIAGLLLLSLI